MIHGAGPWHLAKNVTIHGAGAWHLARNVMIHGAGPWHCFVWKRRLLAAKIEILKTRPHYLGYPLVIVSSRFNSTWAT